MNMHTQVVKEDRFGRKWKEVTDRAVQLHQNIQNPFTFKDNFLCLGTLLHILTWYYSLVNYYYKEELCTKKIFLNSF